MKSETTFTVERQLLLHHESPFHSLHSNCPLLPFPPFIHTCCSPAQPTHVNLLQLVSLVQLLQKNDVVQLGKRHEVVNLSLQPWLWWAGHCFRSTTEREKREWEKRERKRWGEKEEERGRKVGRMKGRKPKQKKQTNTGTSGQSAKEKFCRHVHGNSHLPRH